MISLVGWIFTSISLGFIVKKRKTWGCLSSGITGWYPFLQAAAIKPLEIGLPFTKIYCNPDFLLAKKGLHINPSIWKRGFFTLRGISSEANSFPQKSIILSKLLFLRGVLIICFPLWKSWKKT